jgi:hypothetical protein
LDHDHHLEPLVLDLLEWSAQAARPYAELMEAWRTSCPRLPVWETAVDAGYLQRVRPTGEEPQVILTTEGREFLRLHRPRPA